MFCGQDSANNVLAASIGDYCSLGSFSSVLDVKGDQAHILFVDA